MKRRILSLLLAAVLLMGLFSFSAGAADIIIVAINDTVPFAINEAAMPFYSSGQLYLPYSVFNNAALGVVPSYDSAKRTLTLSDTSSKLTFFLDDGTVVDGAGTESRIPAQIRYGIIFVPADYTMEQFGIGLSYLTSGEGYPVVRLKTGVEVYSDSLFIEKAENLINYRLEQYVPSTDDPVIPPVNTDPPVTDPDPDTGTEPDDPPEDDPILPDPVILNYVYAICGATEELLERMDNTTLRACFLFTEAQIRSTPELARHIIGCGYSFGLDLRGAEDPLNAAGQANEALDAICSTRTALVLCDPEARETLLKAGFFAYSPVEMPPEEGASLLLLEPEDALLTLRELQADKAILSPLQENSVLTYPEETIEQEEPAE